MITEKDLREAIAECEGQRNPTANTCIKLAAFYTIKNNLYPESKEDLSLPEHSYSFSSNTNAIEYDEESEFSQVINGMDLYKVLGVIDELMETLKLINPKLYGAVLRKLSE